MYATITPISTYHLVGRQFVPKKRNTAFALLSFFVFLLALTLLPSNVSAPTPISNAQAADNYRFTVLHTQSPVNPNVVAYIRTVNKSLSYDEAMMFAKYAIEAAAEFKINLAVFLALVKTESGFNPDVTSKQGASGLTQVIPKWHESRIDDARKTLGVYSIYEPKLNLYVGASALREYLSATKDLKAGLLRYNGSSQDPKATYASAVMGEAYRVQSGFLDAPKL